MHKKIKYIIAATLVTASISGYLPINMFENVEVYAATYSSAKTGQLSSLKLTWNNGKSEIKLLDSYYGDEVDLSDDKEYYANVKSINEFNVSADVKGSGYVAKIFTSSSKTAEGSDSGEEISMGSGYKDIYKNL